MIAGGNADMSFQNNNGIIMTFKSTALDVSKKKMRMSG